MPRWQRALFGLYSVLFALVLPLICWGAYAEPGHPHRVPHFVFVPPVAAEPGPAAPATRPHPAHHGATGPVAQAEGVTTQQQPQGRATLSLMLFSILTFVVLGAWSLTLVGRRYSVQLYPAPIAKSVTLRILPPPPRAAAFAG